MARQRISRVRLGALLLALGVLLAACSSSGGTTLTVVFMRNSDATQSYWNGVVHDFEAANPGVHVDLKLYSRNAMLQKIGDLVKQGKPPDVAMVASGSLPQYVVAGQIDAIDSLMSDGFHAEFNPVLLGAGAQYQGRTFGLPISAETRALFYNSALFKQAGIAGPPQRWNDLQADAMKISALGNGVRGFGLQGSGDGAEDYFYYFLWGTGGDVLEPDGIRAAFDAPEGVKALQFVRSMIQAGATQPDPTKSTEDTLQKDFLAGRYGMIIAGPQLASILAKQHPFDYGIAPIPYDSDPTTLATVDELVLFTHASHKDLAWKFMQFVYDENNQIKYTQKEGFLPVTVAAENAPVVQQNKTLKLFADEIQNASFDPLSVKSDAIDDLLVGALQSVYAGQEQPEAAVKSAAAKVNELLSYAASAW